MYGAFVGPADDANVGAVPLAVFSLVWLWCGGRTEVGWYLGFTRNGVANLG